MYLGIYGEIDTPVDDPCQFSPSWRATVAGYLFSLGVRTKQDIASLVDTGKIINRGASPAFDDDYDDPNGHDFVEISPFFEEPRYRHLAADPWIVAEILFFDAEADNRPLSKAQDYLRLARRWFVDDSRGAVRRRIEPLLLTEATLKVIALDIMGKEEFLPAVISYERLYFSCRDDNGALNPSLNLVQHFATPLGQLKMYYLKNEPKDKDGILLDSRPLANETDVWKAIAANMGYDVLIHVWTWQNRAHGLKDNSLDYMMEMSWKVATGRLLADLFTERISHEDVARVLATFTSHAKYISDDRKNGAEGEEDTLALLEILHAVAPKMREISEGGPGVIDDEAIRARIESQRAIDAQVIDDKGKDVSDAIVDRQIAEAIRS